MLNTFENLSTFEQDCRTKTHEFLQTAPADLQAAVQQFDSLFHHLYLFSCCHWGCHGKEHVFEYLGGRCVSSLAAGWRLTECGYYDEALSLVRSVGEIANLLNLFWGDDSEIRQWLDLSERERRKRFQPKAVRDRLTALQWLVPFDNDHYGRLCELAVHPTPLTRPNAHRDQLRPVVGADFQQEGFVLAAWELCWALAVVAGPIAKVAIFPEDDAKAMVNMTADLFELAADHVDCLMVRR